MSNSTIPHSLFTSFDIDLFKSGKHYFLFEKMGAHICNVNEIDGVYFSVWAPSASNVSVIGDFNFWDTNANKLNVRWDQSGIWEGFIPNAQLGMRYKFAITNTNTNVTVEKIDPFGFFFETPPLTASIIWNNSYNWSDTNWMQNRIHKNGLDKPITIYEVHLESWKWNTQTNKALSYNELGLELVQYLKKMQFTHVEFMPVMEYPYSPSWGYQVTGYFAPTSRFGNPQEFRSLIDLLHQNDIGVILDWVPAHFPSDSHALGQFDGTCLYEHPDIKKGYHPDWKSLIFNYGRPQVISFLISNAIYWLQQYHADGLRIDAVASMLYLDYSRDENQWEPNIYGGNHNLEAVAFIKDLNQAMYTYFPDTISIAEESTSFSNVTKPVNIGGLGFGAKWMMGWMNDTLQYFSKDPIYRKYHQNDITFSLAYAFTENFMLPLSHDEVVHGKKSIISKMPGDNWQQFANARLLYAYMYAHPGSKLLFMGSEFGQWAEWNFMQSLDWNLLEFEAHAGLSNLFQQLNITYKSKPALYEKQFSAQGFEWIAYDDNQNSVIAFIRKGHNSKNDVYVICNFSPMVYQNYNLGVNYQQPLIEILNTDNAIFGGSGVQNSILTVNNKSMHNKPFSASFTIPPLAVLYLQHQ